MKAPLNYVIDAWEEAGCEKIGGNFSKVAQRAVELALADAATVAPEAQGLGAGPWTAGLEAQRQQLQLDYFAMKQRAEAAEARLATLEAAGAAGAWVPVRERLPNILASTGHSCAVSVWLGDHAANFTAFYSASGWYRWGSPGKLKNVSHWRELDFNSPTPVAPAPQQQGQEGGASE